jgi:hypothetical protein
LQRIVLGRINIDAAKALIHEVAEIQRLGRLKRGSDRTLHGIRYFAKILLGTTGRNTDDPNFFHGISCHYRVTQ